MSKRVVVGGAMGLALALALGAVGVSIWAVSRKPDPLSALMDAHYRGLGAMERYEYADAADAFREVCQLRPDWSVGSINLAIALLNQGGEAQARAKAAGAGTPDMGAKTNIEAAERLLDDVIAREPENPWAHFCRGIIRKNNGEIAEAHADFRKVTEVDPLDPNAWLERGLTMTDPAGLPIGPGSKQVPELVACYSRALELNPYLTTATYKLAFARRYSGDAAGQVALLAEDRRMDPDKNPAGSGEVAKLVYGEMGRYARVIDPFDRDKTPKAVAPPPRFDPPAEIQVQLAQGHRWATLADLTGPLAPIARGIDRFGRGVATFDADGDTRLDLYLTAAAIGPDGLHDVLLLHKGEGRFEDGTGTFGLPLGRAGLGVAAGDFDADGRCDLFLTGIGDNRLLRNLGKRFEDVTRRAGIDGSTAISPTARWLDIDQDGDLDLYVVNHGLASEVERAFGGGPSPTGLANVAYRNDGQAAKVGDRPESNWAPLAVATESLAATEGLSIAFSKGFPGSDVLGAGKGAHSSVAALDVDEDRDIDLVVTANGEPPLALLNDREGKFHAEPLSTLRPDGPVAGLLAVDLDKDGRPDLVAVGKGGRVSAWRNATTRLDGKPKLAWESIPTNARGWRSAQAVDLDCDTWADLVGLADTPGPAWARNGGARLEAGSLPGEELGRLTGMAVADLLGDALPDLVLVGDGVAPKIARNLGNGNHWLALDLAGRWSIPPTHMRTNSEGLGARLSLEGRGINVQYDHSTTSAGPAQSVGPVVLGLGSNLSAPLLRIRWPDGVMQCELNVTADKTLSLAEYSRKTGSCPVLFTWNGTRFECLGDFLGGGGLGYLVAPGVFGQPDRDESVAIAPEQLQAVDGVFRLSVVEPMDEVAYLDKLTLEVVDRPPGVDATPDERFAPEGPRPTGELIAWRTAIEPARASDHLGRDVTSRVRAWDRRTVDQFRRLRGWIGYTEDHALILNFADRLSGFPANRKLVLCLAGWVEYPYSQTNYAAATAGVTLHPPVLERQRPDGSWEVLDPHPGYPAGLPRRMTVDLTGKVAGPRCVLRLRTNMELYWDQAFVAIADPPGTVRSTSLPVARAELRDRGYLREVSPDGRLPLLYDYDHVEPAPLARMQGSLTRLGDVVRLLTEDDDQLCTVGPGDEVRLEFDSAGLPGLPAGWTRSYVLRSVGYCKDADPFTAGSDTVGPLPWRGMPPYPFASSTSRPSDPEYARYLRDYQTRPAGVR